jgi:hypothetical protein
MTVGVQQDWNGLNNQAGQIALNVRNAMQTVTNFTDWFATLQTSDLEAMGGDDTDIATLQQVMANLAALAQIYQGQPVSLTLPFNFMDDIAPMWGGQ